LENETALLEKRQHQLKALIDEGRRHALRAAQEMKLYVSGDKSNSAREQLQQSIAQCEKTNAALKREYDLLQQDIPLLQHQIQNWTVIEKYFYPSTFIENSQCEYFDFPSLITRCLINTGLFAILINPISITKRNLFCFMFGLEYSKPNKCVWRGKNVKKVPSAEKKEEKLWSCTNLFI